MEELADRIGKGDLSALQELQHYMNSTAPSLDLFPGYDYENLESVTNAIIMNNQALFQQRLGNYYLFLDQKLQNSEKIYRSSYEVFDKKIEEINKVEEDRLEELSDQLANTEDENTQKKIEKQMEQVRIEYAGQRNQIRQSTFASLTGSIYKNYTEALSTLPKMWSECVPLLRFNQEEDQRNMFYYELCEFTISTVDSFINLVINAGDLGGWEEANTLDWEAAQAEIEELERLRIEAVEEAWNKAAEELARQKIPAPVRAIQSLIGKETSLSYDFGPISLSISPTSITVEGALVVAGEYSYDWVNNSETVGLGVGAAFKKKGIGEVGTSTLVTITFDSNTGNVKEIDWKASAGAQVEVGKFSIGEKFTTSVMHGSKTSTSFGWGNTAISN